MSFENQIRRIVTGHNELGKSVIIEDQPTPHTKTSPHRPGVIINNLWMTESTPAQLNKTQDAVTSDMALEPRPGGNNFRVVEFPPEADYIDQIDPQRAKAAFGDMGASHALSENDSAKHPFMHKTRTLDYAIVLSGEIYLVLDEGEVLMKAGDICIQRATNHVWSNRSEENCQVAFILIDAVPE